LTALRASAGERLEALAAALERLAAEEAGG
jgi:hypothetical protein